MGGDRDSTRGRVEDDGERIVKRYVGQLLGLGADTLEQLALTGLKPANRGPAKSLDQQS